MYIKLNPHSGEPLYKQLKERIQFLIVSGKLKSGDQIDSVRALATKTKLNPTTVAKVFTQLQFEGYLIMRPGLGAFVSPRPPEYTLNEKKRRVRTLLIPALIEAVFLGLSKNNISDILDNELNKITGDKK
jgi:GntR family transcriptional regulator